MNVRIKMVDGSEESFDSVAVEYKDYYIFLTDIYQRVVFRSMEGHVRYVVYEYD